MKQTLVVAAVALAVITGMQAQEVEQVEAEGADEKVYYLFVEAGGGYLRDLSRFEYDEPELSINRNQWSMFGRIMWRPGNLLKGGLEFGYNEMYVVEDTETGGEAVRSSVPLFLVFAMSPFDGINASIGYGVAFMNSKATGPNGEANGSIISTAVMGALSYQFPITEDWRVGLEGRYTYMDHLDDHLLSASVLISYTLHTY